MEKDNMTTDEEVRQLKCYPFVKHYLVWLSLVFSTLVFVSPAVVFGLGADGWWKTILCMVSYVVVKFVFYVGAAASFFGSLYDAHIALASNTGVYAVAVDDYLHEMALPIIVFNIIIVAAMVVSHIGGII